MQPNQLSQFQPAPAPARQIPPAVLSGANWFFWIAGLSLVNSVVALTGSTLTFLIGLGISQFVDAFGIAFARHYGPVMQVLTFAVNLLVAGIFAVFGLFARRGHAWAFIVGMVLYFLDALIFLALGGYLSLAFHAWALFGLYVGLTALRRSLHAEAMPPLSLNSADTPAGRRQDEMRRTAGRGSL